MFPFFYKKGKREEKRERVKEGKREKEKRKKGREGKGGKGRRREGQKEEGAPDIYSLPRTVSSARLGETSSLQALTREIGTSR